MDEQPIGAVISEIERGLVIDDPAFVRRFDTIARNEAVTVVTVFVLLAVGAALLTVTLATTAAVPGAIAVVALIGAALADKVHQRGHRFATTPHHPRPQPGKGTP